MSKSKKRFDTPKKWSAHGPGLMQEDAGGYFVYLRDYDTLLWAYKGALLQLDRAAKLVKSLKTP